MMKSAVFEKMEYPKHSTGAKRPPLFEREKEMEIQLNSMEELIAFLNEMGGDTIAHIHVVRKGEKADECC